MSGWSQITTKNGKSVEISYSPARKCIGVAIDGILVHESPLRQGFRVTIGPVGVEEVKADLADEI
jgi:hypothetical protein